MKALPRLLSLRTWVALLLVTIKALVWAMSGSIALLASAADSALDLLASLVTFFAVRYAATVHVASIDHWLRRLS